MPPILPERQPPRAIQPTTTPTEIMNSNTVLAKVRDFVTENVLYARPEFVVGDTDPLLGTGIVDSMGVMEIVVFLEEQFGLVVEDVDITEANLGSLQAISRYVSARIQAPTEARQIA